MNSGPPKNVYLDMWVWIRLSRVHHGKSEEWREAYDAVVASATAGTVRFPLSFAHLKEIATRRNDASRGRLIDFIMEVWNADAIRPWPQMLEPEAENAVRVMMDKPPVDLTNFVFGKGIPHVVGGVPTLVPKHAGAQPLSPEVLRRIAEAVISPDLLAEMKDSGLAAKMAKPTRSEETFIANLQTAVDAAYSHPDKSKRHDIAEARFMINIVGRALVPAMMRATQDPMSLLRSRMSSREQVVAIRKSMPTFHTFFVLDHARAKTQSVKASDLWDLALNIAIPYCDIVVTERSWCNIAQEAGLDNLYGTRLVHTSSQLAALLRTDPAQ